MISWLLCNVEWALIGWLLCNVEWAAIFRMRTSSIIYKKKYIEMRGGMGQLTEQRGDGSTDWTEGDGSTDWTEGDGSTDRTAFTATDKIWRVE